MWVATYYGHGEEVGDFAFDASQVMSPLNQQQTESGVFITDRSWHTAHIQNYLTILKKQEKQTHSQKKKQSMDTDFKMTQILKLVEDFESSDYNHKWKRHKECKGKYAHILNFIGTNCDAEQ